MNTVSSAPPRANAYPKILFKMVKKKNKREKAEHRCRRGDAAPKNDMPQKREEHNDQSDGKRGLSASRRENSLQQCGECVRGALHAFVRREGRRGDRYPVNGEKKETIFQAALNFRPRC